ncbi:hypothetical protein [Lysobacter sp. F6437]|uniref:hypothetical protein n=1 Tax=Lysobacter sp. F6437 TaxID=3459296 RepID=UPI00403DB148
MSFDKLIAKVTQAEDALEANERRVGADLRQLKQSWKASWTPTRIMVAGVVTGFLVGRAEPLRSAARGGSVVRIVSLLSGLFASTAATHAASEAEQAADTASDVATAATPEVPGSAHDAAAAAASERIAHERLLRHAAAARQTNAESVD